MNERSRRRYTLTIDEETAVALRRLADAEERTQAAQVRILIRAAAQAKGLWTPRPLLVVSTTQR